MKESFLRIIRHSQRNVTLLVLLLLAVTVSTTAAHSVELIRSEPVDGQVLDQSPPQVTAWFNEEMQTGVSTLQVFNANGEQVDNGDGGVDLNDPDHASMIVTLPPLPDGAYFVRWHIVLLDGDPTDGDFTFFVGEKTDAPVINPNPIQEEVSPEPDSGASSTTFIAVGIGVLVVVAIIAVVLRKQFTS